MTDAERLAEIEAAADPYPLLDRHMCEVIGHKLLTLMMIDRVANEAARVYPSNPSAYPVKRRKPLGELTPWSEQFFPAASRTSAGTSMTSTRSSPTTRPSPPLAVPLC